MKKFFLIVFITFFVNDAFAQGINRNGKITTTGSEYVNKNGAIGSANGVDKYGKIVITTVTSLTGRVWMDRNLGATQVATSSTDAASYGDLYQWGRGTDGHQLRTSATTTTLSSTDAPGHGDFITPSATPKDWRSVQNDNLWQGVSDVNNPCPTGFRIPTEAEFNTEMATWSAKTPEGAFGSPLKLPMAGGRNGSGSLVSVGTYGSYWSSTVSGANAQNLDFTSSSATMTSDYRAWGLSVRCLKDDFITTGLVMHLDAGNPASYPGTGTTWTDLSGNGNHGTLINGVTYTSANNGILTFDGVDDYFSTTLSMGDANTSFSWGGFVKVNATTTENYFVFGNYLQNGTTPFFAIAFNNSGDNTFLYLRSSTNIATTGSSTNLDLNTWYYLIGVRDAENNQVKLYVNGQLIITEAFLGSYDVKATTNNFGGVNHLSRYLNCNIGQVQFYNRALTTEEIQQNYNAVKSRYGL